jgi:hypothetical protein
LELGDPSYLEESLDDDGTEKRYNLLMDITVLSAFWMKTSEERLIHKINVKEYEHMTSGRPIFLDQIVLVKTP